MSGGATLQLSDVAQVGDVARPCDHPVVRKLAQAAVVHHQRVPYWQVSHGAQYRSARVKMPVPALMVHNGRASAFSN